MTSERAQALPGEPPMRVGIAAPAGETAARLSERLGVSPAVAAIVPLRELDRGAGPAIDLLLYAPPRERARPLAPDLGAAAEELAAFAALGPRRLVLLSSAAALDPHHHNPGLVAEGYRSSGRHPIARAWRDLESLAAGHFAGADRLVLRPAPVATRDERGRLGGLLPRRLAVAPPGYDPPLQLLDLDDLAEAVAAAVERGAGRGGVYHVAPAAAVPARRAVRMAGALRLPAGWGGGGGSRAYLRHNWTVSGERLERELGFAPRRTSAGALRRLAGDPAAGGGEPSFDDFGFDERYVRRCERTLFRFLHDVWWRIEIRGTEHLPRSGPAVLTGVHRGFMPWDGVMALVAVRRAVGRTPRFLIHPALVKPPFLAPYMSKLGGMIACRENADRVLGAGGILGMFPEGIHGAFTPYRRAYRLGRFGRDEYVRMALRNRAPIVPFVTVGSAEIYPILGRLDWKWVKRATEWLYLPLCPNFPFPGVPLPSKWHTRILEPLPVHERYGPEAAGDRRLVRAISREVRARMRAAIGEMLARRRSIFRGSVFDPPG